MSDSVSGIFQLPSCVLTFPEEVDYLTDSLIKIHAALHNYPVRIVKPIRKSIHYGVYLTISYASYDKLANNEESNIEYQEMPSLLLPDIVHTHNVEIDDSINTMCGVYKADKNTPLFTINASGLSSKLNDSSLAENQLAKANLKKSQKHGRRIKPKEDSEKSDL